MQILLNPRFMALNEFVQSLPDQFDTLPDAEVLHQGRNVVKMVEREGVRMVVKSYEHLSIVNRLLYGRVRRSKAVRAYRYAKRLLAMGIDTPTPIAVVDIRRRGVLHRSLFMSAYSDYESAAVINSYPAKTETLQPLMDALAKFIFRLHDAGVLHKDLNITNILYKPTADGGYKFQLIDINRMDFKSHLSMNERIKNMRRLSCHPTAYAYILEQYASQATTNEQTFQLRGLIARLLFEIRQRIKSDVKMML